MLKTFLSTRLEKWKRLEQLTARASRFRLTNLSGEEVREFGRLYRRTAADLAIAREEVGDKRLVNYLNHLVGRAHGAIYRSESSGFGVFLTFFRYELPAVFRKTFKYTLISFLTFFIAAVLAFTLSLVDDRFADTVNPDLAAKIRRHDNWTSSLLEEGAAGASFIQANNIQVTFYAFAAGLLAGIGTLIILAQNGILLGMVFGLCLKTGFKDVPIFVAAHGTIELTAIFMAGGAGLLIGKSLIMPGDLRRIDALTTNGLLAVKLILGCIPMLLIAGLIEGFISPQPAVPAMFKFAISIVSGLLLVAYFLKRDLRQTE